MYKIGKKLCTADALSRLPQNKVKEIIDENEECFLLEDFSAEILPNINTSSITSSTVAEHTLMIHFTTELHFTTSLYRIK